MEAGQLKAAIEICPEELVQPGCGHRALGGPQPAKTGHRAYADAGCKAAGPLQKRRAIILETQSCNANAIGFYLHEGFELIGLDRICYTNHDLQRREVRLEFGWIPEESEE